VRTFELDPATLGFAAGDLSELRGGPPDDNAGVMRRLLAGQVNGARRSAVVLNAAAAMAAETGDLPAAVAEAETSIDSGAALAELEALVDYSQKFLPPAVD